MGRMAYAANFEEHGWIDFLEILYAMGRNCNKVGIAAG